jgi:drug/metabolite transporter (DMT)-like permease
VSCSVRTSRTAQHAKAQLQIHACVVLWGFTAILGKSISLRALPLVWWRMLLVSLALFVIPSFWTGLRRVPRKLMVVYAGIGVLVAVHWVTFYAAIKLANASVAATCLALAPVFTALLEPLLTARRFERVELAFGVAVVPGVALVVGATPVGMRLGVAVGVLAALLVGVFGPLNKRFIGQSSALAVTGIEILSGTLFLTLLAPLLPASEHVFVLPDARDTGLLLALALLCTLLPYSLSLVALRELSAFSAALAVNMEPVYAILLAIVIFGEQRELNVRFYAGVAIILLVVSAHPLVRRPHRPA